jgi:hypothetical protein
MSVYLNSAACPKAPQMSEIVLINLSTKLKIYVQDKMHRKDRHLFSETQCAAGNVTSLLYTVRWIAAVCVARIREAFLAHMKRGTMPGLLAKLMYIFCSAIGDVSPGSPFVPESPKVPDNRCSSHLLCVGL